MTGRGSHSKPLIVVLALAFTAAATPTAHAAVSVAAHRTAHPMVPRLAAHGSKPASGWSSVTLGLRPSNPALIAALAKNSKLGAISRKTMLAGALASPSSTRSVADWLTGQGLQVTAESNLAVTASGPAAVVNRILPAARPAPARRMSALAAPASPITVPADLAGQVSYIVGGAAPGTPVRPALARPRISPRLANRIDGYTARGIYGVPATATANDGQGITIATLQFSGWDATNLSIFAFSSGLPDPVPSNQYQSISVDGTEPSVPIAGDDLEVALDQESIYDTAPQADQVAYFAPNTTQGWVDGINAVTNDALNNTVGLRYTALSVSWGLCEAYWNPADASAIHTALASLAAAGVTIFSSSGDNGAFDCSEPGASNNTLSVGYPASDPNIIAVGGLSTDFTGPSESVWWDTSLATADGYAGAGGGGGESVFWTQPGWQAAVLPSGGGGRLVPDISLDADPNTGFDVYDSAWQTVGGTSLASPLAAATLADVQIAQGADSSYGDGNIAPNLYAAPHAGFRDTVVGDNGFYSAGVGFDVATGLGAPLWGSLYNSFMGSPGLSSPALSRSRTIPISVTVPTGMTYTGWRTGTRTASEPTTCDATGSSPTVPTAMAVPADGSYTLWVTAYAPNGHCFISETYTNVDTVAPAVTKVAGSPFPLGASQQHWTLGATDAAPSSRIARYVVTVIRVDTSKVVWSGTTTRGTLTLPGLGGVTYLATVRAQDRAGNLSSARSARLSVPLSPAAFRYSTGWVSRPDANAAGGRYRVASSKGRTATIKVTATRIVVYGLRSRGGGTALVYVDGRLRATLNFYNRTTAPATAFVVASYTRTGSHTVLVKTTGTHARGATGSAVTLEGIAAVR
jgi:hypothetical protein